MPTHPKKISAALFLMALLACQRQIPEEVPAHESDAQTDGFMLELLQPIFSEDGETATYKAILSNNSDQDICYWEFPDGATFTLFHHSSHHNMTLTEGLEDDIFIDPVIVPTRLSLPAGDNVLLSRSFGRFQYPIWERDNVYVKRYRRGEHVSVSAVLGVSDCRYETRSARTLIRVDAESLKITGENWRRYFYDPRGTVWR